MGHELVHAIAAGNTAVNDEYLARKYQASIYGALGDQNAKNFYDAQAEAAKNADPNFNVTANANFTSPSLPNACQ